MAATDLSAEIAGLGLTNHTEENILPSNCLSFSPSGDFAWLRGRLGNVDRYLIRLFDENSDGSMNDTWVKSRDAHHSRTNCNRDIFARHDHDTVAQALERHLRWRGQPDKDDNSVSWTSSLLLVLQYAFYRKLYYDSSLKRI